MHTFGLYVNYLYFSQVSTCADPESFPREGPTLTTFFVDEGRRKVA